MNDYHQLITNFIVSPNQYFETSKNVIFWYNQLIEFNDKKNSVISDYICNE